MLTLVMILNVGVVITMGCGADVEGICPANIIESEDWQLENPKNKPIDKVRVIRDEIKTRMTKLLNII